MRKTFGSAFALIMVALFTVAPASPATAAGGIHLHMAGKVGQKAVGTTIIFGADRLTDVSPVVSTWRESSGPNGCLGLSRVRSRSRNVEPVPHGWGDPPQDCWGQYAQVHNVPPSGNLAGSVPLPALPAGEYSISWGVYQNIRGKTIAPQLIWNFTIGDDGTFTAIRAVPLCELQMPPMCIPGGL